MRVHDVDTFVANERAHSQHVVREGARAAARVHVEAVDQFEPRLFRLGLEPVARDHAEQDTMAMRAEARHELNDRIGAARPPAVGRQVQDRQRRHGAAVKSAVIRSPTSAAEIPRMHGCSIGHAR